MAIHPSTTTFLIEIGGTPLSDEIRSLLVSVFVDDSLNVPDMFVLTFRDADRKVLLSAGIEIGKKVTIKVVSDIAPAGETLLSNAEVTALEAEFEPAGTLTVVRGFDQSHRLFRGRRTETYKGSTYSDIARKVAQRAGLGVGRIDPSAQTFTHVSQASVSDWQFLSSLAREIGYEVAVVDGKLDFREPAASKTAPASGTLRSDGALQLVLGEHLLRFRSVVTSAEQVNEVEVRGWDVSQKKAVMGRAQAKTTSATLSVKPTDLAASFGSPTLVSVDTPYASQSEVDTAANALSEEIASSFAAFDGVARGNPMLRAGTAVSLGLADKPFDGQYTLTTTRHIYDPSDGYTTWFTVSGRQERSLLGLASRGGGNGTTLGRQVNGVVPAIVTDANDPEELCRIKVKFPWMSDTYESDWVRTVQTFVGNNYGAVNLHEVNDEVLVAFEHGDIRRPYVVGGLYNGVDKPQLGSGLIDSSTGAIKRRGFISKKGHRLVFLDDDSKDGIALLTGDKGLRISLNKTKTTIRITSNGDVHIEGSKNVNIKSGAALKIEAGSSLDLKAPKVSVNGDSEVTVKSGLAMNVEGTQVSVKGSGTTDIDGGGMCNIHAGLVKIN